MHACMLQAVCALNHVHVCMLQAVCALSLMCTSRVYASSSLCVECWCLHMVLQQRAAHAPKTASAGLCSGMCV